MVRAPTCGSKDTADATKTREFCVTPCEKFLAAAYAPSDACVTRQPCERNYEFDECVIPFKLK